MKVGRGKWDDVHAWRRPIRVLLVCWLKTNWAVGCSLGLELSFGLTFDYWALGLIKITINKMTRENI